MACFGVPLKQVKFFKFLRNSANPPSEFRKISTYDTNVVFRDRKAKQAKMYDPTKD